MPKIKIMPMEFSDILEASALEKICFSTPWSEDSFKSTLENDNFVFFVAKAYDEFAGFAGMYIAAKKEGYICNIAVTPKFRNQRIGTLLTNHLLDYSKKLNMDFLSLEVRQSNNNAIKMYEKCGFKKVGIRKNFYELPQENGVIMTCFL